VKKLEIVHHPNKGLRRKASLLNNITATSKDKIRAMFQMMYNLGGIGLAAPQVGWNVRVFVMNISGNHNDELVFINPYIVEESGDPWEMEEGCLSIPGITGAVERNSKVIMKAKNIDGSSFTFCGTDLAGRCALHEFDHLQGILFIDKARKLYRGDDPL
jgi:peptide deformylase